MLGKSGTCISRMKLLHCTRKNSSVLGTPVRYAINLFSTYLHAQMFMVLTPIYVVVQCLLLSLNCLRYHFPSRKQSWMAMWTLRITLHCCKFFPSTFMGQAFFKMLRGHNSILTCEYMKLPKYISTFLVARAACESRVLIALPLFQSLHCVATMSISLITLPRDYFAF